MFVVTGWIAWIMIKNEINRRVSFHDPTGHNYSLPYMPIMISDDTTVPVQLSITFSKKYN